MATAASSLTNIVFLDNIFLTLAPTSYAAFQNAFTVVLVFIFAGLLLALVGIVGLGISSIAFSRRTSERAINLPAAFSSFALLFASIWAPLATAGAAVLNAASTAFDFLLKYAVPIIAVAVFAMLGWFWGFGHSEIIGIFLRLWSTVIVPLWSVVPMYIFLGIWYVIASIWAWINFLAIRVPSAIVSGIFFDVATCAADTFTALTLALVNSGIIFSNTWTVWAQTGTQMLVVTPDFAAWALSVAQVIGVAQNFFYCICASGSFLTSPLFLALTDGNPSIVGETPGFVAAINATINAPVAFASDVARPFVLGVRAIEDGQGFFDVLRSAHISFNGTANTGLALVNGTLYTVDNILQQYYILIIDAATDGGPLVTVPGAFPRLISCATGFTWGPVEVIKWLINLFVAFITGDLFAYDGQLVWRWNEVLDMMYSPFFCLCDFIGWMDKLFRAIADDITGGGACGGTTGADIGEAIGGCIFYIVAATLEMICCIVTTFFNLQRNLVYLLMEFLIGTVYTLIARADDATHTRCNIITAEDAFYCAVPRNPGAWMFFDYLDFQLGLRDVSTACPRAICNMPSCTPIIGQFGDNLECVDNPLYGVGNYCLEGVDKCIETAESCSSGGGVPSPTDCTVTVDFLTCNLGTCDSGVCSETLPELTYGCNCDCEPNLWRNYGDLIVRLVDCLGKWFVNSFGQGAEFLRCFLTNIAAFVVELLLLLIDVIGQIPRLIDDPDALELSGLRFSHAFEGICNCIADAFANFVSDGTPASDIVSAFETIGKLIRCVCTSIVSIFSGVASLINLAIVAARSGHVVDPSLVKDAFLLIFQGIVEFSSILYYFLAALFYGLTLTDVGNAFTEVGDLVCENAALLVDSIVDFFVLVFNCIIGFVNFFLFPFICGALYPPFGSDAYIQCYNDYVLTFIFECLGELLTQILEIIDYLLGDFFAAIKCIIQMFSCIFGDAIVPSICTANPIFTISDTECALAEFSCLIEQGLCEIGIPADLGCDAFACDEIGFLCDFYALFCRLDLILLDITSGIDLFINTVIIGPLEDVCICDIDESNLAGGFPFIDAIPPTACCTMDGSNSASPENFDFDLECSEDAFLDWNWVVYPVEIGNTNVFQGDLTCTITKHACWTTLTKAEILESYLNGVCCQSPNSTSAIGFLCINCCPMMKRQYSNDSITTENTNYQWNNSISLKQNVQQSIRERIKLYVQNRNTLTLAKNEKIYTVNDILYAANVGYTGKQSFMFDYCKTILKQQENVSIATVLTNISTADIFTKFQKSMCVTFLHSFQSNPIVNEALRASNEAETNFTYTTNAFNNILAKLHLPTLLWPLRFGIGVMYNTPRMMLQYISDPLSNAELRLAGDGVTGAPYLQSMPKNSNPDTFFAAAIVDVLRPNIGAFLRVTVQSIRNAASYTKLAWNTTTLTHHPRKSTASLLYLTKFTANSLQILHKAHVGQEIAGAFSSLAYHSANRVEIMSKRALNTAHTASMPFSKRQPVTPVQSGQISAWRDAFVQRLNDRGTRMLRQTLFGTESLAIIQQRREARILANDNDDDPCDLTASPWECCPQQAVCTNCSVVDRVTWAVQDSFGAIIDYYGNNYPNTQLFCIQEAAESVNYMIVPPAKACSVDTICTVTECATDYDCQLSAGSDPQAGLICDEYLGRCLASPTKCTPALYAETDGRTCYNHDFSVGVLGLCDSANGLCIEQPSATIFLLDCLCPDTFLTVNKSIPFLLNRFDGLPLPCQLNFTCIREKSLPPNTNLTIPANHPYRGTFIAHKTANGTSENFDVQLLAAIDSISNGTGTAIIKGIEDFIYSITSFSENDGFGGFYREFIACDYEDDWFCPLTDSSPHGCCNDLCQERKQGAGLFAGVMWALLLLFIPLILCNVCPLCAGFTVIVTAIWTAVFFTLSLALAYGGGLLCYTPGPLLLVLPLYGSIVAVFIGLLRILLCGRPGAAIVAIVSGLLYLIGAILIVAAVVPGIPTCFGMDLYTTAREIVPPCFPVPVTLIDRTQDGASAPCGTFLNTGANFTLPAIIDCTTTPLLNQTRFRDGLDNVFYIIEWAFPGTNADLSVSFNGSGAFGFLQPYAAHHTTAAHESAGPIANTCFWLTSPSLIVAAFVVAVQITFALIFFAATILVLALFFMPCFFAARTWGILVGQMFDGLYGPEWDAGPGKVKTE